MPVCLLEELFDRNAEYEYNADPSKQAENAVASLPESPPDDETIVPEEEEILINEEPIFIEKDLERHEDEDTTTWLKRINLMASSARATKPAASTKATYTPPQAPNPEKIKISQSTPTLDRHGNDARNVAASSITLYRVQNEKWTLYRQEDREGHKADHSEIH